MNYYRGINLPRDSRFKNFISHVLKGCAVKCKKSPSTDTLQCSFDFNLVASAKKPENQIKYLHPVEAVLRPIPNSLRQLRDEWMTNNGNTGQIPGYSAASLPATVTVLTANQLCCLLCLGKQPAATRCALVGAKHTQMVTETQWTIRTGWRFQKGWTNTSQWDGYNVCPLKTKKSHFMARKMKVMCFFVIISFSQRTYRKYVETSQDSKASQSILGVQTMASICWWKEERR